MDSIDKKIRELKEFITARTDIGTANYVGEEIREICGMVETEQTEYHTEKDDMKWWQKKVKGWTVPFWYSDTPLFSKRARDLGFDKCADAIRKSRKD
jgi:hypothetical protein